MAGGGPCRQAQATIPDASTATRSCVLRFAFAVSRWWHSVVGVVVSLLFPWLPTASSTRRRGSSHNPPGHYSRGRQRPCWHPLRSCHLVTNQSICRVVWQAPLRQCSFRSHPISSPKLRLRRSTPSADGGVLAVGSVVVASADGGEFADDGGTRAAADRRPFSFGDVVVPPLTAAACPLAVSAPPPLTEAYRPAARPSPPPLTAATTPRAVFSAPPLTEAAAPSALFTAPPLTDAASALVSFSMPPLIEASSP